MSEHEETLESSLYSEEIYSQEITPTDISSDEEELEVEEPRPISPGPKRHKCHWKLHPPGFKGYFIKWGGRDTVNFKDTWIDTATMSRSVTGFLGSFIAIGTLALIQHSIDGPTTASDNSSLESSPNTTPTPTPSPSPSTTTTEALRLLIPPFGASCVLLFSVPESPLAQPRNLVASHLIGGLMGILFRYIADEGWAVAWLAPALACSTTILLMVLTNTVHPPAGATALVAASTVDKVAVKEGFLFLAVPVLAGCVVLLVVALLVDNVFLRYPRYWR